jgi:hypothetical protein
MSMTQLLSCRFLFEEQQFYLSTWRIKYLDCLSRESGSNLGIISAVGVGSWKINSVGYTTHNLPFFVSGQDLL